jgi:hypothetical protein
LCVSRSHVPERADGIASDSAIQIGIFGNFHEQRNGLRISNFAQDEYNPTAHLRGWVSRQFNQFIRRLRQIEESEGRYPISTSLGVFAL